MPTRPSLAPPTDRERGNQPLGKLIDQNQMATGSQNPCAFGEPGALIRPMVERRTTDHEVHRRIGVGQLLGHPGDERQSFVVSMALGGLDHVGSSINSSKLLGSRIVAGQHPDQVTGSTPHIEDTLWCGHCSRCQRRGPVADGVMQTAAPALVIGPGPIIKSREITVGRHGDNCRTRRVEPLSSYRPPVW